MVIFYSGGLYIIMSQFNDLYLVQLTCTPLEDGEDIMELVKKTTSEESNKNLSNTASKPLASEELNTESGSTNPNDTNKNVYSLDNRMAELYAMMAKQSSIDK